MHFIGSLLQHHALHQPKSLCYHQWWQVQFQLPLKLKLMFLKSFVSICWWRTRCLYIVLINITSLLLFIYSNFFYFIAFLHVFDCPIWLISRRYFIFNIFFISISSQGGILKDSQTNLCLGVASGRKLAMMDCSSPGTNLQWSFENYMA